jgi:hypothetical protein
MESDSSPVGRSGERVSGVFFAEPLGTFSPAAEERGHDGGDDRRRLRRLAIGGEGA